MAKLGDFLGTWLATDAGVLALLGDADDLRAYPGSAPQDAELPYVVYQIIADVEQLTLQTVTGYHVAGMYVKCYAREQGGYDKAWAVAKAIRDGLHGYRGTLAGIAVQCCRCEDADDEIERPTDGGQLAKHRVTLDLTITYTEA